MGRRYRRAAAFALAITGTGLLGFLSSPLRADDITWIDPADPTGIGNDPNKLANLSGSYENTAHWDAGVVPGLNDNALFNAPGYPFLPYTVTLSQDETLNKVSVINDQVTFNMGGFFYNTTQSTVAFNDAAIFVGDISTLTLQNGTAFAHSIQVGSTTQTEAIPTFLAVDGSAGNANLTVGDFGTVANYQTIQVNASGTLQLGMNVFVDQAPDLATGGTNTGQIVINGVGGSLIIGDMTVISGGAIHPNNGFVFFNNSVTFDSVVYDADLVFGNPGGVLSFTSSRADGSNNIIPTTVTGFTFISNGLLNITSAKVTFTPDGGNTWNQVNIYGSGSAVIDIADFESGDLNFDGDTGPINTNTSTINFSLVKIHGDLYVGNFGHATLNITGDGNLIAIDGEMNVGFAKDSDGTVLISGLSTLSTANNISNGHLIFGDFVVGRGGHGNMTIAAGAAVTVNDPSWAFVGLADNGDGTGGVGILTVDGATQAGPGGIATVQSSLGVSNGELYIGTDRHSQGMLNITNGGFVFDNTGIIADQPTSSGNVIVDGGYTNTATHVTAVSQWLNAGDLYVGGGGTASLTITNGATVGNNFGGIARDAGSTGTVMVQAATWSNNGELRVGMGGNGNLTVQSGAIVSTGSDFFIGELATAQGKVTVTQATINVGSFAVVGSRGTGTLIIQNAGVVSINESITAADIANSTATILVDGAGSTLSTGSFSNIGSAGTAHLTIQNGAHFTEGTSGGLATLAGSHADATVTGAGSAWTMTFLTVGDAGTALLTIQNAATVTSTVNSGVGDSLGGAGTVIVTGANSKWTVPGINAGIKGTGNITVQNGGTINNTNQLVIATDGAANLLIASGGQVTAAPGASPTGSAVSIGVELTGTGNVTVMDPNSKLLASGHINVGFGNSTVGPLDGGIGFLNISNGGLVSGINGYVGRYKASTGTVNVSGNGASWQNSGSFFIAANDVANNPGSVLLPTGSGNVTIGAGGSISAAVTATIGTNGRLILAGGTLIVPITTLNGNGTVTGNGTITGSLSNNGLLNTPAANTINLSGSYIESTLGSMTGTGTLIAQALAGNIGTIAGTVQIRSNGANTSKINSLSLAGSSNNWSGALDLTNNKLVVEDTANHAATLATLKNQALFGRSHPAGILSSTELAGQVVAVVDNSIFNAASFGSQFTDAGSILLMATYNGDANLDKQVTIADLNAVASHWQQFVSDWSQGDFNGDGQVTIADLNAIAANWQAGVGAGANTQSFSEALAQIPGFGGTAPVPEPASVSLLLAAGLFLNKRRRN